MNDDEKKICIELWGQYEPTIRKYCVFKLQSNKDEIEDLVADVCFMLCKKVHESGPPEKPKEWLFSVCRNLLNGKYKDYYEKRDNETVYTDEEYELPFRGNSIEQKEDQIYFEELVKKAESILKEDDYVILDHAVRDTKLKDIAVELNKSVDAVKQKRYRVFEKLRKIDKEMDK